MAVDITVPNIGESVTEVTISSWTKAEGAYVEMDEVVCEIESDKATFELTAEEAGTLHRLVEEGDTVAVGDKVGTVDPSGAPEGESSKGGEQQPESTEQAPADSKEPSAKPEPEQTYASQQKPTESQKAEPRETQKQPEPSQDEPADQGPPEPQLKAGSREVQTERMSTLRKTIAKKMVAAKNETAMLTTFNEVDMSNLMAMRKQYKEAFKEKYDVNLGFMSFFAKAVCEAVKAFPEVNAKILEEDQTIQYHNYVDLGIAVSTPRGLVVPNIRNAESMSFSEIEKSVIYYAKKARDNQISIDEMQGGTFTITNGGIFGSMLSTPILNSPQSAILGMHNVVERPVAVNGQVEIRPIMYVALSYDHRLVDGKESVSFLYRVKEYVEDPSRLLLGV